MSHLNTTLVLFVLAFMVLSLITSSVHGQLSTQRLKLNVCAYTKNPVKQITVVATYKGEAQKKTLSYSGAKTCSYYGTSGKWITFLFSPKVRGFLDIYSICITNPASNERSCKTDYWFPGWDHSNSYVEIFANR